MTDPRYQDIRGGDVKLLSSPDGGALVRLIAGDLGDVQGPGVTHTPMAMVHASVSPGARLELPWRADFNALVYTLSGRGSVGVGHRPVETGQLAVLGAGDTVVVQADAKQDSRTPNLEVVVIGGQPIREPVAQYGPFVMNTEAEIVQAMEDFRAGRMGHPLTS
jgi:redox-sensitive bicupin YhaK (pirin superfamily)